MTVLSRASRGILKIYRWWDWPWWNMNITAYCNNLWLSRRTWRKIVIYQDFIVVYCTSAMVSERITVIDFLSDCLREARFAVMSKNSTLFSYKEFNKHNEVEDLASTSNSRQKFNHTQHLQDKLTSENRNIRKRCQVCVLQTLFMLFVQKCYLEVLRQSPICRLFFICRWHYSNFTISYWSATNAGCIFGYCWVAHFEIHCLISHILLVCANLLMLILALCCWTINW